jgi:hypothetical protein
MSCLYLCLEPQGHGFITVASFPEEACQKAADTMGLFNVFTAYPIENLSHRPWYPDRAWAIGEDKTLRDKTDQFFGGRYVKEQDRLIENLFAQIRKLAVSR